MVYTIPTQETGVKFMTATRDVERIDESEKESISKTFSNMMLFGIMLLVYIGVGALVFVRLEDEDDRRRTQAKRMAVQGARHLLTTAILEMTHNGSCSASAELTCTTTMNTLSSLLEDYETTLDTVVDGDLEPYLSRFEHSKGRWDYFHSLLFVFTLITTIGYGNLTPKTILGRIFCVLFSLVGIPGALIEIHLAGKLLATIFMVLARKLIRHKGSKVHSSQIHTRIQRFIGTSLAVFGVLCLLLFYNTLGAFLYDYTEGWGFVNSFYFCFTTLTTVGFGDLIPQAGVAAGNPFASIRIMYVLFGLALTSTSFELVRTQYSKSWSKKSIIPRKTEGFFVTVQGIENQIPPSNSAIIQKTSFHMEQSTQLVW